VRVPLEKIYRAFPELDSFSDEECWRYVLQVRAQRRVKYWPWLAGIAAGMALFVLIPATIVVKFQPRWFEWVLIVTAVVGPLGSGLSGMLVRDWLLITGIRNRINNTRCTACRHSLLGLPLLRDSAADAVRCPECGAVMVLELIGLTREDLITASGNAQAES
jgi:hypothetical protein